MVSVVVVAAAHAAADWMADVVEVAVVAAAAVDVAEAAFEGPTSYSVCFGSTAYWTSSLGWGMYLLMMTTTLLMLLLWLLSRPEVHLISGLA